MAAQTTDLFRKTGAGTVTTLAAPGKALSATSITVGATTNYPTDTGLVIAIRIVDSAGELVAGTYTEWNAIVASGTSFTIEATPVYGSDQVYPAGSTTQVFIPLSSSAHNDLIDGILVHADQDGTLKAGAVDVAAVLATDVVETAKIKDLNITTAKIADGAVTSEKQTCTVAFRGTTTQSVASGADTIDTYTEVTDLGSDFNHTTGIFTAPYAGIYHFDASMQFADNTARLYIFLVCSTAGTVVGNMGYNGVANGELCAWFGITVALAANETAYVSVNNQSSGGAQSLAGPSYFSGHLVGKV